MEVQQRHKAEIGQIRTLEQRELARRFAMLRRGRGITNPTRGEHSIGSAPLLTAPRYTPSIRCFAKHAWETESHYVNECQLFLSLSNRERIRLLVSDHRCFGCFLPSSVADHELVDCPHDRYCSRCDSTTHHQLMCGPREMYADIMSGGTGEK